jgi:predicted ArsR family transcriptional regulator
MLKEILEIFKEKKLVSSYELSAILKTDESAVKGMLSLLANKGYIQRLNLRCNSCSLDCKTCSYASQKDYYEYIKKD